MKEFLNEYASTLESICGIHKTYTINILSKKTDYLLFKDRKELYYQFTRMLNTCDNTYIKLNFDKYITRIICRKLGLDIKDISNDIITERIFISRGIPNTMVEYLIRPDIILNELKSFSLLDTNALDYIDILNNKKIPDSKRKTLLFIYLKRINIYFNYHSIKEELSEYLNTLSRTYVDLILNEYRPYLTKDAFKYLNTLDKIDNVVVEEGYSNIIIERLKNNKDLSNLDKEETFNDNKIRFYLFELKDKSLLEIESIYSGILLNKILHNLIKPLGINDDNINKIVRESLVDIVTLSLNKKYDINKYYTSSYMPYVLYISNALENIENNHYKNNLIFKGTVEDIVSLSSIDTLYLSSLNEDNIKIKK